MKRLFKVMSASLIALLAIMALGSCDAKKQFKQEILHEDSLMVSKMMEAVDNPTFVDAEDVFTYQRSEKTYRVQDSIFFSIPEKVMVNVVGVLSKSHDPITKESVVNEFENNKRVYLSLPDKPDMYQAVTPPDIPNTKVVDTVIDGKKCRVLESESSNSKITITRQTEELL